MTRPRLLDLYCGAGGAAMGYHRAGFDVTGVDIAPQPNYPFWFIQTDALEIDGRWFEPGWIAGFDAIHASPPCQARTTMGNRYRGTGGTADSHPDLLRPTWEMLRYFPGPVVIENVQGYSARALPWHCIRLHGGMFELGVHRPRLFWTNYLINEPVGYEPVQNPLGVYGKLDGRRIWTRADGTEQRAAATLEEASAAMGTDWMAWRELAESIPPAYTEWIGHQLIGVLHSATPSRILPGNATNEEATP